MREVFEAESQKSQKPRLMTSIATAAGEWLLKHGYDIPVLCKVTKFGKITLKSTQFLKLKTILKVARHGQRNDLRESFRSLQYAFCTHLNHKPNNFKDLYGNWYNKVGHHSALYHTEDETGQDRELNTVNFGDYFL